MEERRRPPPGIRVAERAPDPAEYARLREAVGWNRVAPSAVDAGLRGALYSLCLETEEGEVVGCARVVGDGGIYFYLQDVIVLPAWQGRGLGALLMDAVMAYLDRAAQPGAFLGLMAARGVSAFYERYGFERRPEERPGMYRMRAPPPE